MKCYTFVYRGEFIMKEDLLEYVFKNSKCTYLSDLRIPLILNQTLSFILNVEEDAFSLEDWLHFYMYVTGTKEAETSIAEVKQALKKWVNK